MILDKAKKLDQEAGENEKLLQAEYSELWLMAQVEGIDPCTRELLKKRIGEILEILEEEKKKLNGNCTEETA